MTPADSRRGVRDALCIVGWQRTAVGQQRGKGLLLTHPAPAPLAQCSSAVSNVCICDGNVRALLGGSCLCGTQYVRKGTSVGVENGDPALATVAGKQAGVQCALSRTSCVCQQYSQQAAPLLW